MKNKNAVSLRNNFIKTLAAQSPFLGWTTENIKTAADLAGISPPLRHSLFPSGIPDILDSFALYIDDRMVERLSGIEPLALPVRERIRTAVLNRFEIMSDYKEQERDAARYWTAPFRKLKAARILWRTADRIWIWAGDETQDYNHYTKRALLSGVIASTLLAWLNEDENGNDIKAFLDRRIENVMQLNKILAPLKKKA